MSGSIKKIIFLIDVPLDRKYFRLLGIDTLVLNGFDVEVWDLTPFFHKELLDRKIIGDGESVFNKCRKFTGKKDIVCALSEISKETIVNSFISLDIRTYFIYHQLSKRNIIYCVGQMISFPPPPLPPKGASVGYFHSLAKRALSLKPKHAVIGLCNKLLLKYYFLAGIRPADIAFLSGERSFEVERDPIGMKTHIIWGHAWDYDTYLEKRKNQINPDPDQGVFLDEYFPLHADLEYLGISSPIGVEEYFSKLRTFFDHLEQIHNVRIVIAAHPRSNYPEATQYFGNRPVFKGQTVRLVHESSFVLAHDSTSINYAVLFRKPVMFITMDKMQKCDSGRLTVGLSIESIAKSLKKMPINIDSVNEPDWSGELQVDLPSYTKYQNDFIKKTGTPEIPFWEIYIQSIREFYP